MSDGWPSEFRFLAICESATRDEASGYISLHGIVGKLECSVNDQPTLIPVISAVLRPEMEGKRLDLMAWRLDKSEMRKSLPAFAGVPLIIPRGVGPVVSPYDRLPITFCESGIYGFELFDRDGAFGSPKELIATFMYSVIVAK